MSTDPTIVVITPTYNRAATLPAAIESVLNQTFRDFRYLVVDDGSTDETRSIVESYKQQDSRVDYIRLDTHRNANVARNAGLTAANSEFVAFIDSDDYWLPEKLERQVEILRSADRHVGLVTCWYEVTRNGSLDRTIKPDPNADFRIEFLKISAFQGGSSPLYRRECFETAGEWDVELPRFQDWDLLLRIVQHYSVEVIPTVLMQKRQSDGVNQSLPADVLASARLKFLRKHRLLFRNQTYKLRSEILADHYRLIGWAYAKEGNVGMAAWYSFRSFLRAPWLPKRATSSLRLLALKHFRS